MFRVRQLEFEDAHEIWIFILVSSTWLCRRILDTGDISTGDTSNKNHRMKMGLEASPGDKFTQSVECYPMDTDIYGVGTNEII